jgi:hypothetical protein
MFKVDHSKGEGFEIVKPGEYEVVAVNYDLKTSSTGNNMVVMDYEIRSDVEQPCQGQKILFDNFVVTDKSMWRFQQASKAAQFQDGITFNSYKDWADAFLNKPVRVVVSEREANNGKKYPQVDSFKVSQVSPPAEVITVSDEDVPF